MGFTRDEDVKPRPLNERCEVSTVSKFLTLQERANLSSTNKQLAKILKEAAFTSVQVEELEDKKKKIQANINSRKLKIDDALLAMADVRNSSKPYKAVVALGLFATSLRQLLYGDLSVKKDGLSRLFKAVGSTGHMIKNYYDEKTLETMKKQNLRKIKTEPTILRSKL